MTKLQRLVLVLAVAALAAAGAPRKSRAVGCIQSPCYDHSYEICCPGPPNCRTFSC
jgi:hypothetical protein